jgi:hypothetical protein
MTATRKHRLHALARLGSETQLKQHSSVFIDVFDDRFRFRVFDPKQMMRRWLALATEHGVGFW